MNAIEQNASKQRWPIVWGENRIDHRHGSPPILPGTKTAPFLHPFLHLFENAPLQIHELQEEIAPWSTAADFAGFPLQENVSPDGLCAVRHSCHLGQKAQIASAPKTRRLK